MRAVTSDHINFEECIEVFRPKNADSINQSHNSNIMYLLFDFSFEEEINFSQFSIRPPKKINLGIFKEAYISELLISDSSYEIREMHLVAYGLAAILSSVIRRPVQAPKNNYIKNKKFEKLSEEEKLELAMNLPVLSAGPGTQPKELTQEQFDNFKVDSGEILKKLFNSAYKEYEDFMRAIRLLHLAQLNKKEDLGLSYYLTISAIETIATKAISEKKFKEKPEAKQKWKAKADKDPEFKELINLYKKARGKNKYLKERFIKFIFDYFPPERWEEIDHPLEHFKNHGDRFLWVTEKNFAEKYSSDLTSEELEKIINDMYSNRSKYTHKGKTPEYHSPDSIFKMFENMVVLTEDPVRGDLGAKDITIPTFHLLTYISIKSIKEYLLNKQTN